MHQVGLQEQLEHKHKQQNLQPLQQSLYVIQNPNSIKYSKTKFNQIYSIL